MPPGVVKHVVACRSAQFLTLLQVAEHELILVIPDKTAGGWQCGGSVRKTDIQFSNRDRTANNQNIWYHMMTHTSMCVPYQKYAPYVPYVCTHYD